MRRALGPVKRIMHSDPRRRSRHGTSVTRRRPVMAAATVHSGHCPRHGTFGCADLGTFRSVPPGAIAHTLDLVMPVLLFTAGVVLLAASAALLVRGQMGRDQIRRELSDQRIVFPAASDLPPALARHAGSQVTTGEQARAFSDLIASHLARATAGRTYAQIADEWRSTGRADPRLTQLRETAFMGQTLRGSLLGAYQAWQLTTLVMGLGGLLGVVGLVFAAMGAVWR